MKKKLREKKEYKEYRITLNHIVSAVIYIYHDDPDVAYIGNVVVSKKMRGKGFGSILLDFIEKIAAQLDCKSYILKVARESKNYDWYKRRGYIDYTQDKNVEFIWMRKH